MGPESFVQRATIPNKRVVLLNSQMPHMQLVSYACEDPGYTPALSEKLEYLFFSLGYFRSIS
jgi:hypothetical protein